MTRRICIATIAVVLLAGCVGSTPPRLYTLGAKPSGSVPQLNFNIEVSRLHALDALDRSSVLIRRGENEVDYYSLDQWASDLGDMCAQKMSAEFGAEDPARKTLTLSGDILSFEQVVAADGTAEAHAAFAFEVRKKNDSRYAAPLLSKTYETHTPLTAVTPSDTVTALSQAVESIARDVATDVNAINLTQEPVAATSEHLHTLDMASSGKIKTALNINVTSLRRHEALARNSILVRSAPTTIEYYPDDRWAASVSTIVAEKLEAEFGAPAAGRDTVEVTGTILAFERMDGPSGTAGHVKLDLTLQGAAEKGATAPLVWKLYEQSVPAASQSAADVAAALSQALSAIAAEIANDAARMPAPQVEPTKTPAHLYTLDMTPSGKAKADYNIVVDRLQPNDSLTHSEILIVRDRTNVDHFMNDRWASSLAELVTEKLVAEFGPATDGRKTVAVSGAITGFERVENGEQPSALAKFILSFKWSDSQSETPLIRHQYEAKVPVDGTDAAATVRALSRAVEEVAYKVAADVSTLKEPTK